MDNETIAAAVRALTAEDSERDYILVSHEIDRALHYKISFLLDGLDGRPKKDACTVFLTTDGGDPNGGYRVARCLRHHYKHLRLVVGSFCKSAGTLIAIAADELAIGDLGELGPLDIQVRKESELAERSSGLAITQALQTVTQHAQSAFHRMLIESRKLGLATKVCAEFAGQVATGIAAPLLGQIDPIRLGEMQRAMSVAYEYGRRLDRYKKNLKPKALDRLIAGYPAHGFVIDRKEAAELFNRVTAPTEAERKVCDALWDVIGEEVGLDPFFIIDLAKDQAENSDEDQVGDQNVAGEGPAQDEAHDPAPQREQPGDEAAENANGPGVPVRAVN